jgi:hypothetical protein
VTKAEDGAVGGQGLWRPAILGYRAGYENEEMKNFIEGKFIS